jgi:hypothetical protein
MSATACPRCEAVNCRCDIYAAEAMKRQEAQLAELGKIQPISQQQYQHMLTCQTTQPPQPDRLKEGASLAEVANKWRARIKKLNEIQQTEIAYARHRLDELDAHGLWDSGVAIAEWAIERDRLILCLQDLGLEP